MSAFASADWALIGRQVGNHLWQSTLFAAVVGVLALSLRKNHARTRHWLWMAASVKFLVPFAAISLIGGLLRPSLAPHSPARPIPVMAKQIAQPFALPDSAAVIPLQTTPEPTNPLPGVLAAVWFCGFAAVLANWQRRWRRVSGIVGASACLEDGREVEALRRLQRNTPLSLRKIVSSEAKMEPGIFGIFRPVLWLPGGIADYLTDAQLEAILAHELCHARRRDNLTAAIHMIVEAAFWFHPLVWWLGARLEEERERACDEDVVQLGCAPRAYSQGILKVCEYYLASPLDCAAGVTGGELKKRIEGIMANTFVRKLSFGKKALLASLAALSILGPIGVAVFTSPSSYGRPQDNVAFSHSGPGIRGVVVEQGTSQPIADAEISLYFLGQEQPNIRVGLSVLTPSSVTQTDYSGAFHFQLDKLGFYAVAAKKDGYSTPTGGGSSANVTLTDAQPTKEARLFLTSPGRLTGRVLDEESEKPIPNVRVSARSPAYFNGRRIFSGGATASTGSDGVFVIANLAPGEYVAAIERQVQGKERLLTKFSDGDVKTVDYDFPNTFWPGGRGEEAAIPVLINAGATIDLGELRLKKVALYRLRVHMPPSNCGPDATMQIYEQSDGGGKREITQEARCRQDMLITRFLPGAYRLLLAVNARHNDREMASIPFAITDKNLEITAPLERGIVVDGKVVAADGAKSPDFSRLSVTLIPLDMLPIIDIASPKKVEGQGTFKFDGVPAVLHRISIGGIGAGNYVKEIRYNGSPIPGRTLEFQRSAIGHTITVVIDDKPAAITGSVVKNDKPVPRPFVVVAKWPLPSDESFNYSAVITGNDDGKFQVAGLAPGEYRVVALATRDEYDRRTPNALERAFAAAKRVDLSPSAFSTVTVGITSLR